VANAGISRGAAGLQEKVYRWVAISESCPAL
jgi:hypothetical protein